MKLVLLTNMPSLHQVQLGNHLAATLGVDHFRLVFAAPTSEDREEMGWADQFNAPYILRYWQGEQAKNEVKEWISNADVVVQGRFPMHLVAERIKRGRLTFAYQERFWKRSFNWARMVARLPRIYRRYWSVMRPNYHLLAAGAYVASDLSKIGCFKNRAWKYGYFIDPSAGSDTVHTNDGATLRLLWCARFSKVKQAEDAISLMRQLVARNMDCHLTMVGDGELRAEMQALARDLGNLITFTGWQSSDQVAEHMHQADLFLMTSGFGEGWAMVINEAQNAECMVVANQEVGAAPWLIQHGENGLLYDQADLGALADEIAGLTPKAAQKLGLAGQQSHRETWSAPVAAARLVALSQCLLSDRPEPAFELYADGPCSVAR